ncbi:Rab3 GTPase-activating protein catalytic subunit [Armadillidium vulgare]|nr:Rab3 GTPase-activating protein catalytic subunit [Armadillidium vulgare]
MSSAPKDSDEQEVFEIQDYTTASHWERFTAAVEEILHDWQLTSSERRHPPPEIDIKSSKVEWKEKFTEIKFSDEKEDQLPHYLKETMNFNNDFPGKAHCIVRWYGLREFVTLVPADPSDPLTSPGKAKVVLSSLSVAANNTNCQVPLFVQVNELSDKVFTGVGYGNDIRTDFEMAYVKTPPPQGTHLSGLLDILKSKIGATSSSGEAVISIRFTYALSEWPHTLWSQQPPDFDALLSDIGFSELGKLPFGALSDPVSELQVSTTWPRVCESYLIDSDVQSNLSPSSAPIWSARLGASSLTPCLLSEYLYEFLQLCQINHSIVQILGHDFDPSIGDGTDILNALDRLTGSIPSLSSFAPRRKPSKSSVSDRGPLSDQILSVLLNFLFPDAQSVQEEFAPYPTSSFSHVPHWVPPVVGLPEDHPLQVGNFFFLLQSYVVMFFISVDAVLRNMKSCSVDSFVWRLAVVICHVNHSLGGLSSVAHLFYEVLLELRFRWDNAILIPGLADGIPDMASCIINQKLQMLNCCITHRIAREENVNKGLNDTLDDEEEYFECEENSDEEDSEPTKEYSSWDKPEGRLKRFGNARLSQRNDYLYVPITQEAAPNTEDMLDEQTGELLRLGSDSSGSCQRAKLMSSSLLSDMESFKAANPGAILDDFVRWYSPRDWIEEEETTEDGEQVTKGHLSSRMLIPGNLWKEVWDNAKPVPARRQKRLFDDTREAEKVLQWFYNLPPGQVCLELLPVVMHASLCRVAEEPVLYTLTAVKDEILPTPQHDQTLAAQLELICKRVCRLSQHPPNISQYNSVYYQIDMIERWITKAQSLRVKLLGHTKVSSGSLILRSFDVPTASNPEKEEDSEIKESPSESQQESGADDDSEQKKSSILENLVTNLLSHSEVTLEGGSKGYEASVIKKLFSDSLTSLLAEEALEDESKPLHYRKDPRNQKTSRDIELGKPAGREYLLRAYSRFPAVHSRELPQRLYAVILKNSFRMVGCISQDTLFC